MKFLRILALQFVFLSTFQVQALGIQSRSLINPDLGRILCENTLGFETFTSDVAPSFVPTSFRVTEVGPHRIDYTQEAVPLKSAGSSLDLFYVGVTYEKESLLYSARFDIATQETQSRLISQLPAQSYYGKKTAAFLERFNIRTRSYAYDPSSRTLGYPDLKAQSYTLVSDHSSAQIDVSDLKLRGGLNPQLTSNAEWLKLDVLGQHALKIRLVSTKDLRILTIPGKESHHQTDFYFLSSEKVLWLDIEATASYFKYNVSLMTASMEEIAQGKSHVLKTWPQMNLVNWITWLPYVDANKQLLVVETLEELVRQSSADGFFSEIALQKGQLLSTHFNSAGQAAGTETSGYSAEVMTLAKNFAIDRWFLRHPVHFGEQLIFSTGYFGGVVSYNTKSKQWATLATIGGTAFQCLNPRVVSAELRR